jgi:hypothetical protein
MANKYMKKILKIPGHKGNANQNDTEISSHSSLPPVTKQQQMVRIQEKRNL